LTFEEEKQIGFNIIYYAKKVLSHTNMKNRSRRRTIQSRNEKKRE